MVIETTPEIYQIFAVRAGLRSLKKGFKLNRSYTHKNLKMMTEKLTGKTFKAREYDEMVEAIDELLHSRGINTDGSRIEDVGFVA